MEIWKVVTDWEIYEVSNLGRIRNIKTGLIKISRVNNRGYHLIQFEWKESKKTLLVHRIVAIEFCKREEGKNIVNHIDGNQLNNASENLEWCTQKHNVNEAIRMGRFDPRAIGRKGLEKRWGL